MKKIISFFKDGKQITLPYELNTIKEWYETTYGHLNDDYNNCTIQNILKLIALRIPNHHICSCTIEDLPHE